MVDIDIHRILSNIGSMAQEITNANNRKFPLNLVCDMISSVDKINLELNKFRQFLAIGHLNTVSIPLHKDKIYRVLKKLI